MRDEEEAADLVARKCGWDADGKDRKAVRIAAKALEPLWPDSMVASGAVSSAAMQLQLFGSADGEGNGAAVGFSDLMAFLAQPPPDLLLQLPIPNAAGVPPMTDWLAQGTTATPSMHPSAAGTPFGTFPAAGVMAGLNLSLLGGVADHRQVEVAAEEEEEESSDEEEELAADEEWLRRSKRRRKGKSVSS